MVRAVADRTGFQSGDRLYCVMAEARTAEPGSEVWAGLAWAVDQQGQGGLFVEAHGYSDHQVRYELTATLEALLKDRADYWNVGATDMEVIGCTCEGEPVCALVMAVYETAPWLSVDPA